MKTTTKKQDMTILILLLLIFGFFFSKYATWYFRNSAYCKGSVIK